MDELKNELLEETAVSVGDSGVRLEVRNGPEDGRVFAITAETVRIGRRQLEPDHSQEQGAVQGFVIRSDKAISRDHCELTALSSKTFLLKDLGSRFGTELNGVRISEPTPCRHGDTITIGDTTVMLLSEA